LRTLLAAGIVSGALWLGNWLADKEDAARLAHVNLTWQDSDGKMVCTAPLVVEPGKDIVLSIGPDSCGLSYVPHGPATGQTVQVPLTEEKK
jgi:hypothetical protein